ncbi:putative sialate O-acetylesterase domain, SGNH hydrolase superfamily [Helianthus annuus]|uniref:Putative SGNH hydrolase-type esterase domain-containing protein n=1 Tax=Helianthus annuus TaxID=4232 RepID=A0A251TDG4_HELAN|nr:probable carbohydrate esterase At4g34215 isoform X2 [Helianthus annuus]KAF5780524.1 putative sialate O-acetylesterase domain, SGNH hydrolase superfamily [Helianthus annuus]KAJ0500323.1 putative sialate O-acetylesterase domain, SGNH hydrolase superfamily [Helianthus annuus]KAJ0516155.1 putative sialate O-acetylesterase domain, SGNH hydrolase superfamily [Helianthus annuus]KAJ0684181.1 putative sialate O-acetylesterase domain, SGNH hydrolase superfamily [Helianthus annuus]KAJ0688140.1 putativ
MANNGLKLTILFLFIITYEYCSTHVKLPTFTNTSTRSTYLIKDVFILAGQSNMAGRGGVIDKNWDGIIPPEVKPRPGKILRLGGDLTWEDAHEPLHIDIDVNKTCGVGPGMAFANAVLRGDPRRFRVVGLVPCAIGGSGIGEWSRGGRLYDELTRRAAAAGEGGGEIRGVLWFQGERDTLNISDAELYKERLRKLFIDLRTDLKSPLLPVIQVALASGEGPYIELVRKAQHEINLPNVVTVDAKGLLLQPDGLHLSTNAQVQVGKMLAHAMLRSRCYS